MMAEYYRQRASVGELIITESSHPSHDSRGYLGAPGIYTDAHVKSWRQITHAVHAKGGWIDMQIAHDARQNHVDLSEGKLPIAPSVVSSEGKARTAGFRFRPTERSWRSAGTSHPTQNRPERFRRELPLTP
jgi:N-ethylmaleimide reductase